MTSLTGRTEQSLPGTVEPPSFSVAMLGATGQLGAVAWVWAHFSPASSCLAAPLQCLSSPSAFHPFGVNVLLVALSAVAVWAISVLPLLRGKLKHSDPSIVDRLWSLTPWLWCWHLAAAELLSTGALSPRLAIMTALSTAWGVRLTANFAIKGGYSGGEDYRWAEVRSWFPGWRYELFNAIFICTFQQVELLAITCPAATAYGSSQQPLSATDAVATVLFLLALLGETVADWQMYAFQTEKYRRKAAGDPLGGSPYAQGFIDYGLWGLSRHPNYFCEVSLWWAFYLFSVAATGSWANWTLPGPFFLTLLFVPPGASLDVTEALSSRKYPAYAAYQARVSRFVPWFPRKSPAKVQ